MSELTFKQAKTDATIKAIYEHTTDAFSDSPDFKWTYDEIKKEVADGWELYSAEYEGEIIAAIFLKNRSGVLMTKNTAVKMAFQGSGFSHEIKEFIEREAKERKVKEITHYCRIDNFRMYSLNESHGYEKTGVVSEEDDPSGQVVEWVKKIR